MFPLRKGYITLDADESDRIMLKPLKIVLIEDES